MINNLDFNNIIESIGYIIRNTDSTIVDATHDELPRILYFGRQYDKQTVFMYDNVTNNEHGVTTRVEFLEIYNHIVRKVKLEKIVNNIEKVG